MTVGTVKIQSGERPKYFTFGAGVNSTTTNQASDPIAKTSPFSSFQAVVSGTSGSMTATVDIQGTNDDVSTPGTPANWCNTSICTITLNGTTPQADGWPNKTTAIPVSCPFRYVRANVTNVTGTLATCFVLMGN